MGKAEYSESAKCIICAGNFSVRVRAATKGTLKEQDEAFDVGVNALNGLLKVHRRYCK